jgi:hypothetical protein
MVTAQTKEKFTFPSASWMFPILMTIFAIGGTTYGMAEETLAFYVPDRQRPGQPGHAHIGGGDGRVGDRPRGLRHLVALRVAAAAPAGVLRIPVLSVGTLV